MNAPLLDEFISTAGEFCSLAEREEPLRESDLWQIRGLLLRLIFHMPSVEAAPHGTGFDGARPDDVTCDNVARRFGGLPFNGYRVVFDPHDLEAIDEPVAAILSDDLADIYRDLAEGLSNYQQGHLDAACFDWCDSYRSHWARHAVNALAAIEIYRTDHRQKVELGDGGDSLRS